MLPDHYMGGAKANGKQAASQPEARPVSLQLCHGLSVCLHVLRGTTVYVGTEGRKAGGFYNLQLYWFRLSIFLVLLSCHSRQL